MDACELAFVFCFFCSIGDNKQRGDVKAGGLMMVAKKLQTAFLKSAYLTFSVPSLRVIHGP